MRSPMTLFPGRKGFDTPIALHYPGARSDAMGASGALNRPSFNSETQVSLVID